jgi:DUF1680 family protein
VRISFLSLLAALLISLFPFPGHAQSTPQQNEARIIKAKPLALDAVRLTGGPLKRAQQLDAEYLLQLEPDRMLAFLRERAGLKPKAQGYGGWDGPGRQLTGHIAGHYLSAVSLMYAATGDKRFKDRADYIVAQLKEVQDAQGDGYIGALMDGKGVDGKKRFEEIRQGVIESGGFDLNGLWSPWYVEHKIFAGLRDAYRYTGNRLALEEEVKFAAWTASIVGNLTEEQDQKMLATEFGGMNEVLADLYADTGDARWLHLSDKFEQKAMIDPLAADDDVLGGKHGNTNIPKLYGSLVRYIYTGNDLDQRAAEFFWDAVANHHSFATGGDGKNEYFGARDKMADMIDGRTAETCNVYNMIKFSRTMFAVQPNVRYADFHERALFNHILASQDTIDGRVSYMVPVGRGVQHEYQDKFEDFTCCVGTGMESHALHAYGIYFEEGDKLWVSLYAPTAVNWRSHGEKLEMKTGFPIGENASLTVVSGTPKEFTLELRRPGWAGEGFSVKVNGKEVASVPKADSYVEITRTWKPGDTVSLVLPKRLHVEPLPDDANRLAVLWGPLVLAGDLGPEIKYHRHSDEQPQPLPDAPALVTNQSVTHWLKPVATEPGAFRTVDAGLKTDITFKPFYEVSERRYAIYWDVFTPSEWKVKEAAYRAEQEKEKQLQAATVSFAQPGQMQSERDFNEQGEETRPLQEEGRYGRAAKKWFSFDMPVEAGHPQKLLVTFSNDSYRPATVEVLVDGQKVGEQNIEHKSPEQPLQFKDVAYDLPVDLVKDKKKITVRFQGQGESGVPGIFGIRIVRGDTVQ